MPSLPPQYLLLCVSHAWLIIACRSSISIEVLPTHAISAPSIGVVKKTKKHKFRFEQASRLGMWLWLEISPGGGGVAS